MKTFLIVFSLVAAALGLAAIAYSLATHPPHLGFRIMACVLLIDQATLTLLALRLPVDVRPLTLALRIGSLLIIVAGALILVWSALPHDGAAEIAMPAIGVAMILHGAATFRYVTTASRAESA